MHEQPPFPPEDEEEAPPDALPASPGMRKVAIVIYILIVVCVILGLLLSLVWSGFWADRWGNPLPDTWSV
jgi:ABC-type Fe3+ transport system permease subunit